MNFWTFADNHPVALFFIVIALLGGIESIVRSFRK